MAAIAARRGTRMVLDSSGAGLRCGLEGGNVHLVKPSLDELRQLSGRPLSGIEEIGRAAMDIGEKGVMNALTTSSAKKALRQSSFGKVLRHAQIVSVQAARVSGRFTDLFNAVAALFKSFLDDSTLKLISTKAGISVAPADNCVDDDFDDINDFFGHLVRSSPDGFTVEPTAAIQRWFQ